MIDRLPPPTVIGSDEPVRRPKLDDGYGAGNAVIAALLGFCFVGVVACFAALAVLAW